MTGPTALAALTPAYLARLVAPTGLGDLVPADLAGEVGSVVGGGGVRVTLRRDRAGRVTAAAFRALGSLAARGPGSVLVERCVGATLDALRALRPADLLAPLGPVPTATRRAAATCVDALDRALEDGALLDDVAAARADAPGLLTCRCLGVGDREIRRAVARGATTVPMIGADCAAGTGCHSCWPDLRVILDEETTAGAASGRAGPRVPRRTAAPPSVVETIRALVAPSWRAQGVTLGDVAVDGATVRLEVTAIAADAMASPIGAVALAHHVLRETMDETVRVVLGGPRATP